MKFSKKNSAIMMALILMFTIAFTMFALPISVAHTPPWQIPTTAYVSCSPRTVGLGQYTLIVMWLDEFPPTAGGNGGDRWRNFMLNITKPNGSQEILGPFTSGPVGTTWTTYVPDQIGTYTIVFSWPGQTLTNGTGVPRYSAYEGDFYQASTSDPAYLTVTSELQADWVEPPIPNDYWTRPLNSANRGWSVLPSNWLGGSWLVDGFQRWGSAPSTGHILYTKPIIDGGIQDAAYGATHGQTTDYESMWSLTAVMNGKIYAYDQMYPDYGYYCLDLRSGEKIWYKNGTDNGIGQLTSEAIYSGLGGAGVYSGTTWARPSFAQLYHYYGLNGAGVVSHLWMTYGSNWYMLDALTGDWIMTLTNVPSGTGVTDQDGSILRYSYSATTGRYLCWNVTKSIGPPSPTGTGEQQWEPRQGATIDAVNDTSWYNWGPRGGTSPIDITDILPRSGYSMNTTGPTALPSLSQVLQDANRVPKMFFHYSHNAATEEIRVVAVQINEHAAPYSPWPDKITAPQQTNLGFTVTKVMDQTFKDPISGQNLSYSLGAVSYDDKTFTIQASETRQKWFYSLETGNLISGPTTSEDPWNYYGQSSDVAYGNLYSTGYGGKMYCYNMSTGQLKWTYNATGIGYESPYGDYPLSLDAICEDKIYLHSTEHSPTTPLWRGSYLRCVNATTGEEIWKILNFVQGFALADGYIVTGSWYDQQMYVFGKGQSATSVTGSPKVSVNGNSVLIEGTVTDQSPGAKGTPAIADANMDEWMEYLYEQQTYPADAKGVDVQLNAIDPNGNYIPIGTVTSDINGGFKKTFTPEIPGEYTIIATFTGSGSYGSSHAQTYISVTDAPAATAAPTPEPATNTDMYVLGIGTAAIIAIVIIGLIIILMLRKRP